MKWEYAIIFAFNLRKQHWALAATHDVTLCVWKHVNQGKYFLFIFLLPICFFLHFPLYDCTKAKKSISFSFAVTFFLYFKAVGKEFLPETWSWEKKDLDLAILCRQFNETPFVTSQHTDKGQQISRALPGSFIHLATNHLCGSIFLLLLYFVLLFNFHLFVLYFLN